MPTETFELIVPMKGHAVKDTFTKKGETATHVQLIPASRPNSVISITKEEYAEKFRLVTA